MTQFSICIPNFNYAHYLGQTLDSVLSQSVSDLEILIADNASTDGSVALVQAYQTRDSRIKLRVNRCNVGFFENLSRAADLATGRWMTMLSSDDLMQPAALAQYQRAVEILGEQAERTILSSAVDVIDGSGKKFDYYGPDWKQWAGATLHPQLTAALGCDVWVMPAARLLRNALLALRTPFYFATTTYSRSLHDAVEGYCQGGLYNPDKRFAWALLGQAEQAVFIDSPLFSYRIHQANQDAQQLKSGALKHLTDEYISTFSLPDELLSKAGLARHEVIAAYVEQDIALRGLQAISKGKRHEAQRIIAYGLATYPEQCRRNRKFLALRSLVLLGPVGEKTARALYPAALRVWKANMKKRAGKSQG